ncbi:MAG: hypothetical protein WBC20_04845, partial [Candidatus Aminicenantaceae bacterium]
AWFLSMMERRAKPETEQLLTRWGKSCVFSESTGLSLNILGVRLRRIPSNIHSGRLNLQSRFIHSQIPLLIHHGKKEVSWDQMLTVSLYVP